MSIVSIDSQTLIWAIKKQATAGQEDMISRAEYLLETLERTDSRILIPSPIITETIAPFTDSADRQAYLNVIYARFRIASLDAIASVAAGEIWNSRPSYFEQYEEFGDDGIKNRFKYDILIAGIVKVNKVEAFYCHDRRLRNIAIAHGINALDIPEIPTPPPDLFTRPASMT